MTLKCNSYDLCHGQKLYWERAVRGTEALKNAAAYQMMCFLYFDFWQAVIRNDSIYFIVPVRKFVLVSVLQFHIHVRIQTLKYINISLIHRLHKHNTEAHLLTMVTYCTILMATLNQSGNCLLTSGINKECCGQRTAAHWIFSFFLTILCNPYGCAWKSQ